jgi:AcrR family transcriptional regulator
MSNKSPAKRIGRPAGADADRTRTLILEAALEAFAERGFEGASIREITGAAGVGHNLVHHYFGSKDDLWRATVHHALDPTAAQIADLLGTGQGRSTEQTMRAGVAVLVSGVAINPAAVRLLVGEALRGGPRFDAIFDEVLAPIGEVFISYFRSTGESLAVVDPRVLTLYVFGAVFGSLSVEGLLHRLGLVGHDGRPDGQATEDLIELVLKGLLRRRR